jgi:ribonuclease P protein component
MNLSKRLNYYSLADKDEISVILKYGTKKVTRFGPVFFYYAKKNKTTKIAILVKKAIGKAHYRNYIKRIIRYYIRTDFTLLDKYNRVIFLYRYSEKIKFKQLKDEYDKKLVF